MDFASSTVGLKVSAIASFARIPERVIVGRPYSTPRLIPLVENTKSKYTSDKAISAVMQEVESLIAQGICTAEEADKTITFGPGLCCGLLGENMALTQKPSFGGKLDTSLSLAKLFQESVGIKSCLNA